MTHAEKIEGNYLNQSGHKYQTQQTHAYNEKPAESFPKILLSHSKGSRDRTTIFTGPEMSLFREIRNLNPESLTRDRDF